MQRWIDVKRYGMLSELAECTLLMLKVIHEMYSTQRITYEEFVTHTEKKLQFLSENVGQFTSEAERENAYDIISKCSSILSEDEVDYLQ
jgi:hypothetical protein